MSFGSGRIWMNGTFVDWANASIHVASHVVHYGSGVFEGARCYDTPQGPACFRLDTHIRRLYDSAKIYRMTYDLSLAEFENAVLDTIRHNEYRACYIRPLLYRGYHTLGVNPFSCPVEAAILVWEWGAYLGEDSLRDGVDVQVSSWGRGAPNRFPSLAKSTANYANSQLIKMESVVNGYAEGIALDPEGFLSEGSGQNLFLVRDGAISTPPVSTSTLPGITRDVVMTLARDLGIDVREETQPREALYIADELFFTGTAAEITPIRSVDKVTIGSGTRGPITTAIQERFFDVINGQSPDTHRWLTYVYPDAKEPRPAEAAARPAADRAGAPDDPPRQRADAYVTGLRMLARRELFTVQLREKLKRKGFPDDDTEEALRRLRAEGSLNDGRAAAAFAHDAVHLKLRGRQRTQRELTQLGVSDSDARSALEAAYGEGDEPSIIERALARRLRGPIGSPAEYRRLYQGLRRQGFDADLVANALRPHVTTSARASDDDVTDEPV